MAKVQHTCTGCVPIDASIIDVYVTLVETNKSVTAAEASRSEAEAARVAAETLRTSTFATDHGRAVADHSIAQSDHATAGSDHEATVAATNAANAAAAVANAKAELVQARLDTADADHTRAEGDHSTAVTDHSTASSDHTTAQSDHTTAGADHTRAETDHSTAASDHTASGTATAAATAAATLATEKAGLVQDKLDRADTDHTRAESDHTTAVSDHGIAGTDHSTATGDHTTASADHTLASADHTTAASDHTTAGSDHTLAAADHTLAAADHVTAEADHTTWAGYRVVVKSVGETAPASPSSGDKWYKTTDNKIYSYSGSSWDSGVAATTGATIVNSVTNDVYVFNGASLFNNEAEVTQLEHKVDDLSTGKYYGYFAQEEDLPEADVDGFAYVGEGPTYTIYNLRGGVWTSSDVTVNQSPIGNEEDIDQNESGKLQFANRVYNSAQPNGMGYKILRKDATFASQVTDTNTIYEIRYPFDLNNATVNVPAGSVLLFNGGKVNNGTLSGDFKIESPLEKIFSGISFSGGCVFNEFYLEWFTDRGTDSVNAVAANDASADLNAMFASGIKRVFLTNQKYYYLASTVTIPGRIVVTGEEQVLDQASNTSVGISPCFYVSGDTTAIKIDCGDSDNDRRSLFMKGIHIRNINPIVSQESFKENIPMVLLDIHQKLWGVDLELFVSADSRSVSMVVADGTTKTVGQLWYTGLEVYLHGANNYFTYANFTGFYRNLRRAINIHKELSSNWITDIYVAFDSSCTFGGEVYSARVTGKHQTRQMLPDYEEQSYFTAVGSIYLDGTVWDGGSFNSTSQVGSTYYAARSESGRVTFPQSNYQGRPYPNTLGVLPYDYFINAAKHPSGIANFNLQGNLLEDLFHKTFTNLAGDKFDDPSTFRSFNVVRSLQFVDSSDNVVNITKENVSFYDKLFKIEHLPGGSNTQQAYIGTPVSRANVDVKELRVEFLCPVRLRNAIVGAVTNDAVKMTITLLDESGNNVLYKAEPDESWMTYYANYAAFWLPISVDYKSIIRISCVCKKSGGLFTERFLPKLFLTNAATSNSISPSGGMIGGNLRMADAEFFNAEKRLAGFRTQCNRIVADEHLLSGIYVASTTQIVHATVFSLDDRYLHIKLSNKLGEYYVDIDQVAGTYKTNLNTGTLKAYIKYASYKADFVVTYKATGYISVLEITGSGATKVLDVGEDLSTYTESTRIVEESGTTANRPTNATVPVGFQYFDSDLGKPIWNTGSGWVDSTGAAV